MFVKESLLLNSVFSSITFIFCSAKLQFDKCFFLRSNDQSWECNMWLYGWRNWTALPYCTILFTLAKQGAYFNLTQDERFWRNILEVIWFRKKRLPVVSIKVNSFEEEKGFSAVLIRDSEFISKQPCIPGIYFFVSPVPKIVSSPAYKSSFVAT